MSRHGLCLARIWCGEALVMLTDDSQTFSDQCKVFTDGLSISNQNFMGQSVKFVHLPPNRSPHA